MEEEKSLLRDLNSSKLRLPIIRRINIRCIPDGNKKLNSFLQNWVPFKLDMLWVNYYCNIYKAIKMDFYIDSISKAIRSVSTEIYFWCFGIKEPELEQIIKSASNWERLTFSYCDIHCSKKLDFSGSAKYKIKLLSFISCARVNSTYGNSDWKTTPSCFKNIVEAIARSRLKDSLQEVDISYNHTLNKDEVQAMFNELKMPHISVVK